jgi:iron(III) transport system permease protein
VTEHGTATADPGVVATLRAAPAPSGPARPAWWRRPRRLPPRGLLVASLIVVAVLLAPLSFLVVEASGVGIGAVAHLIWRPLTGTLLWNTVRLAVVVTLLCAVIGTLTAWCVERTDLPGRRVWAVLVVIPFAIPDFVVSFGWASLSTWVQGFRGAVLVMTLAVYPLVYLPVAAALRSADPSLEETSRSLGVGRVRTFLRVTLGQVRGAVFGGCVLVVLVVLAEYGAFPILGYQTFTTEIYSEFQQSFNVQTACALSLVLVAVSVVVLAADLAMRGKGRSTRTGPLAQRSVARYRLGRSTVPVLLAFGALAGLALGIPVSSSVYWVFEGGVHAVAGVSLLNAGWHTALYSGSAALLDTLAAVPLALLSLRHSSWGSRLLERSSYVVLATPGIVIALSLSYFSERYADGFAYQTAPLLVLAYAILSFPLALVAVRASLAHASVRFEEVARSLGQRRLAVLARVTLPLVAPGLAAAFALVFLATVTELTATLILVPTGVQTLATQFWAYQQNLSYGQAAPFALAIIAIAVVPSYVISRYFDRLPSRSATAR